MPSSSYNNTIITIIASRTTRIIIIFLFCLLADDDFVGGIQSITFPPISVADFENIFIACTEFIILEDKLAFEEVESFNVSLLPLEISEDFLAEFGKNTSATVEISDNDCKFLSLNLLSLAISLSLHSGDTNLRGTRTP